MTHIFPFCRHPLFPLLALLFEKCELSTLSSECITSASFDVDIENFVRSQEKDGKPFFSEDPELDNLVSLHPPTNNDKPAPYCLFGKLFYILVRHVEFKCTCGTRSFHIDVASRHPFLNIDSCLTCIFAYIEALNKHYPSVFIVFILPCVIFTSLGIY